MIGARIQSVETFIVSLPRDVPYLGPLGPGEKVNEKGYIVRRKNRTIYPSNCGRRYIKVFRWPSVMSAIRRLCARQQRGWIASANRFTSGRVCSTLSCLFCASHGMKNESSPRFVGRS